MSAGLRNPRTSFDELVEIRFVRIRFQRLCQRSHLASQTLTFPSGRKVEFPVDGFPKHCLLEGIDELGYIQQQEPAIAAYEAAHPAGIDTRA